MNRVDRLKYAAFCIVAVIGMAAIMAAPAATSASWLKGRMLGVHLVLELFAVLTTALVVTVSWHTFDRRDAGRANALIAGFTVVAACDLWHALTYPGMPTFLSESDTPRAIFFWLMARTFEVVAMGAIALSAAWRVSRLSSLAAGAVVSGVLIGLGSHALDRFPVTFVEGVGVTAFKAGCEYTLCALNLLVAALLWRRAVRQDEPQHALLALSSFMMGVGGLAFTSYVAPSDFQNIAGHLYKVVAYALLYRTTFITSIREPFEALRASEAQVRDNQARMATLGANLPQSVLYQVLQDFDGRMHFTQVTDAIERINGLRVADVLRDPLAWYGQIHPDDLPMLQAAERRSAETGLVFDCEARLTRADGVLRRMHFVSAPRRLDDGRLVWDGIQTDITERSEAQEARRLLEAQLREAQKMESIGTLASGIAHDFNNVLGSILGNAAMASEDVARGARDDALRGMAQVQKAGLRARSLVNQILAFGRRQVSERVAQPLQPVVEDSVALLRATLPAQVVLAVRVDGEGLRAQFARTQLEQVILNLCTNAWHALGERGGRIEVHLCALALRPDEATALGLLAGPHLRLRIEDNGCGMDEATLRRVFEPFFTTKPVGQGTGLGLAVVHGIVKAHEGAVAVDSQPGRGTRFDVWLPALEPAAPGAHAPLPTPDTTGRTGAGQRVLYVDDDEVMSLMVERLLQRAGYTVTCAREPAAAIAALRADPDAFDIVVSDYNMPVHSGLDVIDEIKAVRPGMPALLSSGSVSDELRAKARACGIVDVLEKQNTLEELAPAIERVLAQSTPRAPRRRAAAHA